jgi:hypothetical protein
MLDMMFRLFPFALNKQICSQQEKYGSRKDEVSDKADNHPCQLILTLIYLIKLCNCPPTSPISGLGDGESDGCGKKFLTGFGRRDSTGS